MGLLPPLSQDEDGRWYRLWRERLDRGEPPHVFPLQEHPDYEEFWQEKRVRVENIQTPTFLIGAWRDQNPNAMIGAFERIQAPRKLIIGPWMHSWPDLAPFDPVDYLLEMDRWWKAWLRDEPGGIRDEPPVTIYVQGSGWRHEAGWPIATRTEARYLDLGGGLSEAPAAAGRVAYRGDLTLGIAAGLFDPAGTGLGLPVDQGPDDRRSLSFTSEPMPSDLEITGTPVARLRLVVDEGDDINFVVKLCDVAPDGGSRLITTGWLKGSHWRSHERAEAIPIGEEIAVTVPLMTTSYCSEPANDCGSACPVPISRASCPPAAFPSCDWRAARAGRRSNCPSERARASRVLHCRSHLRTRSETSCRLNRPRVTRSDTTSRTRPSR